MAPSPQAADACRGMCSIYTLSSAALALRAATEALCSLRECATGTHRPPRALARSRRGFKVSLEYLLLVLIGENG